MVAHKKVLVVDSDAGMQHFLGSVLERQKYDIQAARSALEALDFLRSSSPGVVVIPTDFLIKDGGWALAEHIRDLEPQQPMIVLKSRNDSRNGDTLPGFGPYRILDRPIDIGVFTRCVCELLNGNGRN